MVFIHEFEILFLDMLFQFEFLIISMSFPKRKWLEPADEVHHDLFRKRPSTTWREPAPESMFTIVKNPFKLLEARPKVLPGPQRKHDIQPILHGPSISTREICHFPRFKRLRNPKPLQAHEKALALKKKNADLWIMILAHLHRYSMLFQKTADSQYQDEHVCNILSNYNQISTARHLQIWQQFADWCEPFGFHPATISTAFLLDFIYEATYQIRHHKFSMKSLIQSLKFVAHQAEIPKLVELLNTPVINGYVSSNKKPQNPREVFPLPFHVAIAFEEYIKDERRPSSSRLILGCFLFMFWTGLRFQDLQRTKPSSISLTDGILRAVCELSKSGQPQPAACISCGFSTLSFTTGWGYFWFDLIQDWISLVKEKAPQFQLDFIFPEVQGEGQLHLNLIPRPMVYSKAASILRHVAKQPFMAPPYTATEVTTLTVHSAKSALISAAKQLDLPQHWIAEQGHHRGKRTQGDRYSRDDTVYQLLLQKTVICKCKCNWRPVTPQARGGQHPIPQRNFCIPTAKLTWPPFLEIESSSYPSIREEPIPDSTQEHSSQVFRPEPYEPVNQGVDAKSSVGESVQSSSDASSEESSSSSDDIEDKPTKGPFFLNHFTRIAHCIKQSNNGKKLPACGAKLFDESLYRISDELPSDFDMCQHKGCRGQ